MELETKVMEMIMKAQEGCSEIVYSMRRKDTQSKWLRVTIKDCSTTSLERLVQARYNFKFATLSVNNGALIFDCTD